MICIHIQSKLNSRTFHESAKGFSCFCSKICQASWELSAHDQPIPAKAWHAIQACEHCSCTQFGEPNPAECSWHVTKVFSLGISFCRDKLHIDQEMLRTSWNLIVPEGIVKSRFSHYSTLYHVFFKHSCHRWNLLFPLVPSSVAAKASARYSRSRCTQCVPCGGASQRAAQWSAVHCVLSRQLTSAAASSSRFRRSSLSEDLLTSCSWVEIENHCWWYSWYSWYEGSQVSWKKGWVESWESIHDYTGPKSVMNFWFVEFFWILPRFMNQISTGTMPGIFRCNVKWCSAIFRRHFVEHLPELSTCPTATFQTSWFDWGPKYLAQSINGR